MPKSLSLEPIKTASKTRPWRLWIPARLSPTGRDQRLGYKTKEDAQQAAQVVEIRAENLGRLGNTLSPAEITIAAKAFSLLGELPHTALLEVVNRFVHAEKALKAIPGATLEKAVEAYVAGETERLASRPFGEAFDEFQEAKGKKSEKHKGGLRRTGDKFAYLDTVLVSDITPQNLLQKLKKMPAAARNQEQRHLRAAFNFFIKREWRALGTNPVEKLDFMDLDNADEVQIFSVDQTEKLLTYALTNEVGLLPYLVFGFFCGIRSDRDAGELSKLQWKDIHLVGGARPEVEIRPTVAKTGRRRFVGLSDNALAWIEAYRQHGGKMEGSIVPYTPDALRYRRGKAREAAGLERWIQAGMRHTYCSCWLAKHKDVNRLVLESGHDSPDTMWRHYHRGVTEVEAEKFWAILPPAKLPNVISMKEAKKTA